MRKRKRVYTDLEISNAVKTKRRAFQRAVTRWATNYAREFPWRKNRTPYRTLVAEILLRRTTASAALRIYENFLNSYPTFEGLAKANNREIEASLSTIGYHKERAKILKSIARFVVQRYHGELPRESKKLLQIPHIGSYTAGAILSFSYGVPTAIVDSNVERIIRRVFSSNLSKKVSLRVIQNLASALVPKENHQVYNYGLLDLGAIVCRYNSPRCRICPLKSVCDFYLA